MTLIAHGAAISALAMTVNKKHRALQTSCYGRGNVATAGSQILNPKQAELINAVNFAKPILNPIKTQ